MIGREKHHFRLLLRLYITTVFLAPNTAKAIDGNVVHRLSYSAYGEPTVFVIKRENARSKSNDKVVYDDGDYKSVPLGPSGKFEPRFQPEILIPIAILLGALIMFTIIGNILVVAAIFLEKSLQRLSNYLIASLAVADLMVAVFVMPISALDEVSTNWFLGISVCDFWIVMDVLCCTASILHLVGIAVDRYWAVTRVDYSRRNNKKLVFGMITCVWVAAASISLPGRFVLTKASIMAHQVITLGICMINQDKFYTVISTVGAFYLPMAFLVFIYVNIYVSARRRIRKSRFKRFAKAPTKSTMVSLDTASSAVKSLQNGVSKSVGQKVYSDELRYCYRDAVLHSPTHWNDNDAFGLSGYSPSPIDIPIEISSPFLCQTPHSTPVRALNPEREATTITTPTSPSHQRPPQASSNRESANALPRQLSKKRGKLVVLGGNVSMALNRPRQALNRKVPLVRAASAAESAQQRKERLEHRRERRAARTLAIITGGFVVCWLPFSLNAFVTPWCGARCEVPRSAHSFLLWLGYANSLLNPILYTIFSPDFRVVFVKILTRQYCRRRVF